MATTSTHVITADSIDVLADVDTSTTAPSVGEVLKWDGTNWVNQADAGDTLASLSDTNLVAQAAGDLLIWDASASLWDNAQITVSGAGSQDGLIASPGDGALTLGLDLAGLPLIVPDLSADSLPFYDASGTANGRALLQDIQDDDWREADGVGTNPTYAGGKRSDGNIGIQADPTADYDTSASTVTAALSVGGDLAAGVGGNGTDGLILQAPNGIYWRYTATNTGAMQAVSLD